ncbi:MAG: hypothetical protein NTV21_19700 [Planctomycetota bacterium]|nr:hypothetical protein [Planctomycetota bacterium]
MNSKLLCLVLALPVFTACVQKDDPTFQFNPRSAVHSTPSASKFVVRERKLAYLADELTTGAGGTDLNGDTDKTDRVAVIVDMVSNAFVVLSVQAEELALVGTNLYIVCDEAFDGQDWNSDTDSLDLVLLRVGTSAPSAVGVTYVDTLRRTASGPRMLATTNDKLFYCQDTTATPLAGSETAIGMIRIVAGVPAAPVRLVNEDGATTLSPSLMGEDNGIVLVTLDESDEARILNADGDQTDDFVLALFDSGATSPEIKSTGYAIADASTPFRALGISGGERVVAFLVDEAAQGAGSLNGYNGPFASWAPGYCPNVDNDSTDEVLHFLWFNTWFGGTSTIRNTALAGDERVLIAANGTSTYVASLVPESDDDNCVARGLNDDGDRLDHVLRWIKVENLLGSSGVYTAKVGLVAVADLPGGTHGATDLAGRWIVAIDEAADSRTWDGNATDSDLIGWLDPTDGNAALWTTDHNQASNGGFVGATWMGELKDRSRLGIAFTESDFGGPINGRDTDSLDSVPVFARFDPTNADDLDFPGPAIAADLDSVGLVIANNVAYYRVDEAADNFDWNKDGDRLDRVLYRTTVSTLGDSFFISTLADTAGPVVQTDAFNVGASYLADEAAARRDFNGDGDQNDFVVQWMRVGP